MEIARKKSHQQHGDADLQQDPDGNDDVAEDEERGPIVQLACLSVKKDELLEPGFASGETDHGAEGPIEGAEAGRGHFAED